MALSHPSVAWADQLKQRQLTAALEGEIVALYGPGATRCFMAESYAAYRSFYQLFMAAFAAAAKQENFMPRIVYFSTLPTAAKEALRDLQKERRLALVCYTPSYNGTIDIPGLKRVMAGAANTILISAPYVSAHGHRISPTQLIALAEVAGACSKTPLHLDMSYARDIPEVHTAVSAAQVFTWDLSFGGLADTALFYIRQEVYSGWRINLSRIRESALAVVSCIRSFKAAAAAGTFAAQCASSLHAERLNTCREAIVSTPDLAKAQLRFITFDDFVLNGATAAFVTLNKLGLDDASWYPGALVFGLVLGRRVISSAELQAFAQTKLQIFIHTVDLSGDVREGSDQLVADLLKNIVVLTVAIPHLFYLLEEFIRRAYP